MTNFDDVSLADFELDRVRKMKDLTRKLQSNFDDLEEKILLSKGVTDGKFDAGEGNNYADDEVLIRRDCETIYSRNIRIIDSIITMLSAPRRQRYEVNLYKKDMDLYLSSISNFAGIRVKEIDEYIVVSTPRIPPSANGPIAKSYGLPHDFLRSYSLAVRIAMIDFLSNKDCEFMRRFSNKTLSIFHVYPIGFNYISDADNHDTKALVDSIVCNLPGGDEGLSCNFFLAAYQFDAKYEGTYFFVSPGLNNPVNMNDLPHLLTKFNGL